MTKARENMIDMMINRYGFEDKRTIEVARACEMYRECEEADNEIKKMIKGFEEEADEEEEVDDIIYVVGVRRDGTAYREPRT